MNCEQVWPSVKKTIEEKCEKGKEANEYIVFTKLNKVQNRVLLHDDFFMRKSKRSKRWQKITKDVVIDIAKQAMQDGEFSIQDPELIRVYGATGCIVCSILDLLDGFEYRHPRTLAYQAKQPK